MDEALHSALQAPPLELDCDQLVGAHPRAVSLSSQLFLFVEEQQKNNKDLETITFNSAVS